MGWGGTGRRGKESPRSARSSSLRLTGATGAAALPPARLGTARRARQRLPAAAVSRRRPGPRPRPPPPPRRSPAGRAARSSSRQRDSSRRVFGPPLHTRHRSGTVCERESERGGADAPRLPAAVAAAAADARQPRSPAQRRSEAMSRPPAAARE